GGNEHVVVVGGAHRADRDEPIAAWAVLDHHGLAPTLAQAVGEQSGADIDAAAGPKRYQELHGALRPSLRRRRRRRDNERKRGRQDENATQSIAHRLSPDALGRRTRVQIEYTGWSKPPVKWVLAHSCGFTLRSSSTPAARTRCALASSAGGVAPSCIAVAASYNMRRAITIARSVGSSFSFA